MKKYPNLFVPGFAKSGTTHFCKILNKSDSVFIPKEKEPHFFADDLLSSECLMSEEEYLSLYSNKAVKYRLDGSISYLFSSTAIKKILTVCDSPKFIVMVRHPFDRLLSHYKFNVRNGIEKRSLSDAIKNDENFKLQWAYEYLAMSDYSLQLDRLLSFLDREDLILIDYSEYTLNPIGVFDKISKYLEIDIPIDDDINVRVNVSKEPKLKIINDLMFKDSLLKRFIKKYAPFKMRRFVKKSIHNYNLSSNDIEYEINDFVFSVKSDLDLSYKVFKEKYCRYYL